MSEEFYKVGIGITTMNGNSRLAMLLDSLDAVCAPNKRLRIYIIDDGSSERNLVLLRKMTEMYDQRLNLSVELGEHRQNLGISAGWNHCTENLRQSGCEYVALLNDDVIIPEGWLETVEFILDNNPEVGTVGFHQHRGGKVYLPEGIEQSDIYIRSCSSGYCFAFRTAMCLEIGYFDEAYYSFYEDFDFGVRVWRAGYICIDAPPLIEHLWGETFRQNDTQLLPKIRMSLSEELFRDAWGDPDIVANELAAQYGGRDYVIQHLIDGVEVKSIAKFRFDHWRIETE